MQEEIPSENGVRVVAALKQEAVARRTIDVQKRLARLREALRAQEDVLAVQARELQEQARLASELQSRLESRRARMSRL